MLLRAEGAQVRPPSQDVQRAELEERVERSDRAAREVEECSKQGDGPVDGLEQLVHEDRRDEIARGGDKVGRDRQAEQSLVRQDARRRRRGVAPPHDLATHEVSPCPRGAIQKQEQTRESGFEARRRFCNPFHHFNFVHIRSSLCKRLCAVFSCIISIKSNL